MTTYDSLRDVFLPFYETWQGYSPVDTSNAWQVVTERESLPILRKFIVEFVEQVRQQMAKYHERQEQGHASWYGCIVSPNYYQHKDEAFEMQYGLFEDMVRDENEPGLIDEE